MRSVAPPHLRRIAAAVVGGALLVALSLSAIPTLASQPPAELRVSARDSVALVAWSQPRPVQVRVELSQSEDFASVQSATSAAGVVVFGSLAADTTYYVRARAVAGGESLDGRVVEGRASHPSPVTSFTTAASAYSHPLPTVTSGSRTSNSLFVDWSEYVEGYHYQWQFGAARSLADADAGLADTNHLEFDGLKPDSAYYFRVRTVDRAGVAVSDWSEVTEVRTAKVLPLRVGTYNIHKASASNWSKRRQAVAATILDQDPDVVGLQEAENKPTSGSATQYHDLLRLLGPNWALTNSARRSTGDLRTIYNADRLTLVDQGYSALRGSKAFGGQRNVAWARFRQKSTGKEFIFVNTHFVWQYSKKAYAARESEARQLVQIVKRANPEDLPVVIGGDFNTHERRDNGNAVYRILTAGGYVDPLLPEQSLGSAENLVNATLHTYVGNKSKVNRARSVSRTTMIDHMMVSRMRVAEWETVASVNSADGFIGVQPSDHNMIRMTVYLP